MRLLVRLLQSGHWRYVAPPHEHVTARCPGVYFDGAVRLIVLGKQNKNSSSEGGGILKALLGLFRGLSAIPLIACPVGLVLWAIRLNGYRWLASHIGLVIPDLLVKGFTPQPWEYMAYPLAIASPIGSIGRSWRLSRLRRFHRALSGIQDQNARQKSPPPPTDPNDTESMKLHRESQRLRQEIDKKCMQGIKDLLEEMQNLYDGEGTHE